MFVMVKFIFFLPYNMLSTLTLNICVRNVRNVLLLLCCFVSFFVQFWQVNPSGGIIIQMFSDRTSMLLKKWFCENVLLQRNFNR